MLAMADKIFSTLSCFGETRCACLHAQWETPTQKHWGAPLDCDLCKDGSSVCSRLWPDACLTMTCPLICVECSVMKEGPHILPWWILENRLAPLLGSESCLPHLLLRGLGDVSISVPPLAHVGNEENNCIDPIALL